MPHSRPTPVEVQVLGDRAVTFERTPWLAQERVLEEPRRRPEEPMQLADDDNVIDVPLDGEAIVRVE
jgi:hypothetical protein